MSNAGPSVAADVVVTDTLPPGLGDDDDRAESGLAASGLLDAITCQLGNLAPGATRASRCRARCRPTRTATSLLEHGHVTSPVGEPVDPLDPTTALGVDRPPRWSPAPTSRRQARRRRRRPCRASRSSGRSRSPTPARRSPATCTSPTRSRPVWPTAAFDRPGGRRADDGRRHLRHRRRSPSARPAAVEIDRHRRSAGRRRRGRPDERGRGQRADLRSRPGQQPGVGHRRRCCPWRT